MSLRIRRLKISIMTEKGPLGTDITFPDGLVVLRADNTSGKSSCIRAIIYALGLERSLSSKSEPPLSPAIMRSIEVNDAELSVTESDIFVEISNHLNKTITIKRKAAGASEQEQKLITVWHGPALSQPESHFSISSFFVRDPGAASRNAGFHSFLTDFIGWNLPQVAKFNGTLSLLYPELMVSLFYIEQTQGWSSIQAGTPRIFQIKEPDKRALEFLLKFDAYSRETQLQLLRQEETRLKEEWSLQVKTCEAIARSIGGGIRGLSLSPLTQWPPEVRPYISITTGNNWIPLTDAIDTSKRKAYELESQEIPQVDQISSEASNELKSAIYQLREMELYFRQISEEVCQEQAQLDAIDDRLKTLDEDLKKNQDAKKLRDYGAPEDLHLNRGVCPTCNQTVQDALMEQIGHTEVMTIEQNIGFIRSQIKTIRQMRLNVVQVLEAKGQKLNYYNENISELRSRIRILKQTLVTDGRIPAASAIKERLIIQDRVERFEHSQEQFVTHLERFADIAEKWNSLIARLNALGTDFLSAEDRNKIEIIEKLFLEQLRQYGYRSLPINTLSISEETYHPCREGFDLTFDVSASDNVRGIFAYILALMELSRSAQYTTNHPGLLIFDEPRQQSWKWADFKEVFRRSASAIEHGQQVIIATSEDVGNLAEILPNITASYISIEGYILKPLS